MINTEETDDHSAWPREEECHSYGTEESDAKAQRLNGELRNGTSDTHVYMDQNNIWRIILCRKK